MLRHFVSFVRCPIGYICNVVGTATAAWGLEKYDWIERRVVWSCEFWCIHDGVQDDWHPWF